MIFSGRRDSTTAGEDRSTAPVHPPGSLAADRGAGTSALGDRRLEMSAGGRDARSGDREEPMPGGPGERIGLGREAGENLGERKTGERNARSRRPPPQPAGREEASSSVSALLVLAPAEHPRSRRGSRSGPARPCRLPGGYLPSSSDLTAARSGQLKENTFASYQTYLSLRFNGRFLLFPRLFQTQTTSSPSRDGEEDFFSRGSRFTHPGAGSPGGVAKKALLLPLGEPIIPPGASPGVSPREHPRGPGRRGPARGREEMMWQ